MRITLFLAVILSLFACFKENSRSDKAVRVDEDSTSSTQAHSDLDEKKLALIETVLNMPDVIRFSKIDLVRKKYGPIYIFIDHVEMKDVTSIVQNGNPLRVLHSLGSVTEGRPCYVFDRIQIYDDSARVRMKFDITGAIAFGKLKYTGQEWVPDKEFLVGVR